MTKPRRPKWIQTQYDIIEQQNKYQKHKLNKREFMKGFRKEEKSAENIQQPDSKPYYETPGEV